LVKVHLAGFIYINMVFLCVDVISVENRRVKYSC